MLSGSGSWLHDKESRPVVEALYEHDLIDEGLIGDVAEYRDLLHGPETSASAQEPTDYDIVSDYEDRHRQAQRETQPADVSPLEIQTLLRPVGKVAAGPGARTPSDRALACSRSKGPRGLSRKAARRLKMARGHGKMRAGRRKMAGGHRKIAARHEKMVRGHSEMTAGRSKIGAGHAKTTARNKKITGRHGKMAPRNRKITGSLQEGRPGPRVSRCSRSRWAERSMR